MLELAFAMLLLLSVSFVTAGSEAAVFTVPYGTVLASVERKRRGADALKRVKDDIRRPITAIVIVSNVASIVGAIAIGGLAARTLGSAWVGVVSAVLTLLVIIFAEIVPKTIGAKHALAIALAMAGPLEWLAWALSPAIRVLELFTAPFGREPQVITTSEEEIKALARIGKRTGAIEEQEGRLIERIFRLNDVSAWEMMTPWGEVVTLDGALGVGEASEKITQAVFSHFPVHLGDPRNVVGTVHVGDILRALAKGRGQAKVTDLAHEPFFVPDTAFGDDLLREFERKRARIAVVVDSLGNVVGVLSIEDVLEELIGERITNEEVDPEKIKRLSRDEVLVDANTEVARINRFFNTQLAGGGRIGDLALGQFGRIPMVGERVDIGDLEVTVDLVSDRAIKRLRLTKQGEASQKKP